MWSGSWRRTDRKSFIFYWFWILQWIRAQKKGFLLTSFLRAQIVVWGGAMTHFGTAYCTWCMLFQNKVNHDDFLVKYHFLILSKYALGRGRGPKKDPPTFQRKSAGNSGWWPYRWNNKIRVITTLHFKFNFPLTLCHRKDIEQLVLITVIMVSKTVMIVLYKYTNNQSTKYCKVLYDRKCLSSQVIWTTATFARVSTIVIFVARTHSN